MGLIITKKSVELMNGTISVESEVVVGSTFTVRFPVAAEIRKLSGYEKTPIVAVTVYARKGDKELFLSSVCNYYLSKPYSKNEVMNLLVDIIQP